MLVCMFELADNCSLTYYVKFGESICGTGWIVFRQREDLAEHIAVTVT